MNDSKIKLKERLENAFNAPPFTKDVKEIEKQFLQGRKRQPTRFGKNGSMAVSMANRGKANVTYESRPNGN